MKLRTVLLLTVLFICGSCNVFSDLTKPKPVKIDRLCSLSALAQKPLTNAELTKVVETTVKQNRVNDEDAQAMLEIYTRQITDFARARTFYGRIEGELDKQDVKQYLGLLLRHESLQKKVWEITITQIIDSIADSVSFAADEKVAAIGAAPFLAAAYHNAYEDTIAKDNEELRNNSYDKTSADNDAAVVTAFERKAHEFINAKEQTVSKEQKENAEDFLQALKIYNDSLPNKEKVLDINGCLVDFRSAATPQQRANIIPIPYLQTSGEPKPTELDQAITLLNNRMGGTFRELRNATNNQIKR